MKELSAKLANLEGFPIHSTSRSRTCWRRRASRSSPRRRRKPTRPRPTPNRSWRERRPSARSRRRRTTPRMRRASGPRSRGRTRRRARWIPRQEGEQGGFQEGEAAAETRMKDVAELRTIRRRPDVQERDRGPEHQHTGGAGRQFRSSRRVQPEEVALLEVAAPSSGARSRHRFRSLWKREPQPRPVRLQARTVARRVRSRRSGAARNSGVHHSDETTSPPPPRPATSPAARRRTVRSGPSVQRQPGARAARVRAAGSGRPGSGPRSQAPPPPARLGSPHHEQRAAAVRGRALRGQRTRRERTASPAQRQSRASG